jgi:DNA-binding HxlR family transcriptional regulator/putative sterol carrier protein
MGNKRTYGDACGIARALDVLGERWALMIVRELLLGPKRFTDLRTGLPHLSADVLAHRLRHLEAAGVLTRRTLPPPTPAKVYELTPSGRALEPALVELGRWGGTYAPPPEGGCGMSLDSHILSLQTLFDPELAAGFSAAIQLEIADQSFRAIVDGGELEVERGRADNTDATIRTDPRTLIDVLHGHREIAEVLAAGDMEIGGDETAAARFLSLAPLPQPAPA